MSEEKQACKIDDFIECDEKNRKFYRTKNEFTISTCPFTHLPKVGFNVSENEKNFHAIALGNTPEDPITCPEPAFYFAKLLEKSILEIGFPAYDKFTAKGFWRNVVIRISSKTKEMLINLVGNKDFFKEDPDQFEANIKNKLAKILLEGFTQLPELNEYKLMGLTFQHSGEVSDSIPDVQDTELELLGGEAKVYHEIICGNRFEVSNSSFL